jgi:hypothetical protein
MANPSGAIRAASTTVRPTPQPRSRKTPFGGSHDPTNVATIGAGDQDCCCHRTLSDSLNALRLPGFAEPRCFARSTALVRPRKRQGFGETGDRETCRRRAIGDRCDDARRKEGERSEQADVPFARQALTLTAGNGSTEPFC